MGDYSLLLTLATLWSWPAQAALVSSRSGTQVVVASAGLVKARETRRALRQLRLRGLLRSLSISNRGRIVCWVQCLWARPECFPNTADGADTVLVIQGANNRH